MFIKIVTIINRLSTGLRVLFNPIFPALNSFEANLIKEIKKHIDDDFSFQFEEQINAVNYVQRWSGGQMVRLFKYVPPLSISWERKSYFPRHEKQKKLLSFVVSFDESNDNLKGSITFIDGVINSINFNESYKFYPIKSHYDIERVKGLIIKKMKI